MPVCPKSHPLKLHFGRNDGRLTCDGPDQNCCGGNGVLEPGVKRYSCEDCDYDLCVQCATGAAPEAAKPTAATAPRGLSDSVKQANFEEAYAKQNLAEALLGEEEMHKLRMNGGGQHGRNSRAAYMPKAKPKAKASDDKAPLSAEELAAAEARAAAAAAALLAEEEAPAKPAAPTPKAAAASGDAAADVDPEARARSDAALRAASGLEELKAALAEHAGTGSAEVVAEARRQRDKLKEKAKKAAKKEKAAKAAKAAEGGAEGGPASPQSITAEWVFV